ncbi:cytochrome c-type biogenesis protein CcmH [Hyphomonas sp. WL0036]|uniref:cytochrome c-type biogenesis protein n=1 Tax=Hyphomonas sediminis TaxID=2866160 RepID=UPI001C80DE06|nr:cytochrome c-type biogenesis protein [Hyphomonas sediminis]MBY9067307.1 cytochrome c-type biogenesis protein CcmH [Hyphomonas sediminis]
MKALLASVLVAFAASAPLEDPAAEARAQALMREVRCVACENEPVSQSSAPIAEDMRDRIREMVGEGASDKEIRDWFVSRYGEFVLFRPPARDPASWLLWLLPFVLLGAGVGIGLSLAANAKRKCGPVEPEDA